jgi:predicted glutamine amidotransferase
MCRLVGYIGVHPITLETIVEKPANSLIKQSRTAREGRLGLNADGFGLGWYDKSIRSNPGTFKSTQPAWNDESLKHMVGLIQTECFVGHVRASTVGDVNVYNCHPFAYGDWLFVHNGTLHDFPAFKRLLRRSLDDDIYNMIKGHTDSEHFFALVMQQMKQYADLTDAPLEEVAACLQKAIDLVHRWQVKHDLDRHSRINSLLTDGNRMIAMRYVSCPDAQPLSLYYALGRHVNDPRAKEMLEPVCENEKPEVVLLASEALNDTLDEWKEVPVNHMLLIDQYMNLSLRPIKLP